MAKKIFIVAGEFQVILLLILLKIAKYQITMKDIEKLRSSLGANSKYFFDESYDYLNKKSNKDMKRASDYVVGSKKYEDSWTNSTYDPNYKTEDYNFNYKSKKPFEDKKFQEKDFSNSEIRKNNKDYLRNTTNCIPTYLYNESKKQDAFSPRKNKEKEIFDLRTKKVNYQKLQEYNRSPPRKYDTSEIDELYKKKQERRYNNYFSPTREELSTSSVLSKKIYSPLKYTPNYYTPKYERSKIQYQQKNEQKSDKIKQLVNKYERIYGEGSTSTLKSPENKKVVQRYEDHNAKFYEKYKDVLSPSSYSKNENLSLSAHPSLETSYQSKYKPQDYSLTSTTYSYESKNRKYSRKQQFDTPPPTIEIKPSTEMFKKKKQYLEGSVVKTPSRQTNTTNKLLVPKKQIDIEYQLKKINSNSDIRSTSSSKKLNISIDDFAIGKNKGQGKFGVVYIVKHKLSGTLYALKKIQKSVIKNNMMQDQLRLEIKLQSYFNHPNILKMYGFFDDKEYIYLLLQYMEEGTLFEQLKKRKQKLPEMEVSRRIGEIANAIRYLHDLDVAHRDIKPQNIVLSNGVAKLCDFGWSTRCQTRRKTYCGTFDYAAPEILEGKQYDWCVDLWCLGVLTFELLTGKVPFYNISRKQTMKKILNVDKNQIEFPPDISWQAKDFVECLVKKDPHERKRADQLFEHPFLQKYSDDHKYF